MSFVDNFTPRSSPDLTGILPEYTGDCSSTIVILSVDLISFEGSCTGNNIELNWTTASEENNDYFIIEKSLNNIDYEEVTRVNGAGNSQDILDYSILDRTVGGEINYYRLTQVDFDGERVTFPKIAVQNVCEGENDKYKLTYNSENQSIFIYYDGEASENVELRICNAMGAVVFSEKAILRKSSNFYETNRMPFLSQGQPAKLGGCTRAPFPRCM